MQIKYCGKPQKLNATFYLDGDKTITKQCEFSSSSKEGNTFVCDLPPKAFAVGFDGECTHIVTTSFAKFGARDFGNYFLPFPTKKGSLKIVTLHDKINLPKSGGSKKIYIYTPSDYDESKEYSVIYMFDGQNILSDRYDGYTPAMQGWCCDTAVENLGQNIILVGIDNSTGSDIRDSELTMSQNFGRLTYIAEGTEGSFADGSLELLGKFITNTLIPYINANYHVSHSPHKTGIVGSSSGGLASFYLGLKHPDIFGFCGAFSPATALFYNDSYIKFFKDLPLKMIDQKMYIYCGKGGFDLLENILFSAPKVDDFPQAGCANQLKKLLTECGYRGENIVERFIPADHNEHSWRYAFYEFLEIFCEKN